MKLRELVDELIKLEVEYGSDAELIVLVLGVESRITAVDSDEQGPFIEVEVAR